MNEKNKNMIMENVKTSVVKVQNYNTEIAKLGRVVMYLDGKIEKLEKRITQLETLPSNLEGYKIVYDPASTDVAGSSVSTVEVTKDNT